MNTRSPFSGSLHCALAAGVLALAGCNDSELPKQEEIPADPGFIDEPTATVSPLTAEQQMLRDNFDESAFQSQYAELRRTIAADATKDLSARAEMDFVWLDIDGNGQLSLPEYSLYALPEAADASEGAGGDYLTSEQAEGLANTYYYFDRDADGSLSQSELDAAKASNLIG